MTYERFDIVVLPFPYSDRLESKQRPCVVLSSSFFSQKSGHIVAAMITTAKHSSWPLDVTIADLASAGLPVPCMIRMKFFTPDTAMIVKKLGRLSKRDAKILQKNIGLLLVK